MTRVSSCPTTTSPSATGHGRATMGPWPWSSSHLTNSEVRPADHQESNRESPKLWVCLLPPPRLSSFVDPVIHNSPPLNLKFTESYCGCQAISDLEACRYVTLALRLIVHPRKSIQQHSPLGPCGEVWGLCSILEVLLDYLQESHWAPTFLSTPFLRSSLISTCIEDAGYY